MDPFYGVHLYNIVLDDAQDSIIIDEGFRDFDSVSELKAMYSWKRVQTPRRLCSRLLHIGLASYQPKCSSENLYSGFIYLILSGFDMSLSVPSIAFFRVSVTNGRILGSFTLGIT